MEGKISSASGRAAQIDFQVRVLGPRERRGLALRSLGLFWGLALATIPLPPLHWVSVPGFFFFGIYRAFRRWGEKAHFEEMRFPCPECGKDMALPPRPMANPLAFVCPQCRYGLKLSYEQPPA